MRQVQRGLTHSSGAESHLAYGSLPGDRTREEMGTRYLTDGVHLYEIAEQRTVQNFGLRRGTISYTIIRDVVSEAVARVDDLHLAALSEVTLNG
jgi:hypothetical protein